MSNVAVLLVRWPNVSCGFKLIISHKIIVDSKDLRQRACTSDIWHIYFQITTRLVVSEWCALLFSILWAEPKKTKQKRLKSLASSFEFSFFIIPEFFLTNFLLKNSDKLFSFTNSKWRKHNTYTTWIRADKAFLTTKWRRCRLMKKKKKKKRLQVN